MTRTAVFSIALIFGGLLRRFGAVLFGIFVVGVQAQRGLVQPRRDAIGRRPDLPITNDGPVKSRLLSPATVAQAIGGPSTALAMHIALRWVHHAHRSSVLPATLQAAYL
jgi:hypothetical protein